MNKPFELASHARGTKTPAFCSGQSLGEYAIIAGLIITVCIPALMLLGGNLSNSLGHMLGSNAQKQTPPLNITASSLPSSSTNLTPQHLTAPSGYYKGTGYYAVILDPVTGKPIITSVQTSQINVAGSNGNLNTLGTTLLAQQLEKLALQQTDPELKNYYGEMAKLSYYLGAAEGELDDVSEFNFSTERYGNGDALQDIYNYHQALLSMMQNPPANANPQQLQEVLPLATEVFNIGHNYVNSLSQFITADGRVSASFSQNGDESDNNQPGNILTETSGLTAIEDSTRQSLASLVPYDEVQQMADNLLSSYPVESVPVSTTLKDAQSINTQSIAQQKNK